MENKLKEIYEKNKDLFDNLPSAGWKVTYNKESDMMFLGEKSPAGSFYVPVGDTRMLLRVDQDYKLYGLAIENTKFFVRDNPQFTYAFLPYMRPRLSVLIKLLAFVEKKLHITVDPKGALNIAGDFTAARIAFS